MRTVHGPPSQEGLPPQLQQDAAAWAGELAPPVEAQGRPGQDGAEDEDWGEAEAAEMLHRRALCLQRWPGL